MNHSPSNLSTLPPGDAGDPTGEDPIFETGQIFAGRYRIERELGRGGMGRVFKAHDLVLGVAIALKVLPDRDPTLYNQLVNEVRLALQVTSPFVCRVFDFGQSDGETYLTMEYVDGEDLRSLLRKVGHLSNDKTVELARQACTGLSAAHAQGILHRDLKPANLLINGKGQLQVTDFGISTSVDMPQLVQGGTPAYMAPELFRGEPATVQSDIYSLGVTLFELATGNPLFRAGSFDEFAELERNPASLGLRQELSGLNPDLAETILQCLQPSPAERPQSAREVAAGLPGGDLVRRALDAGETPSPEAVAGAATDEPGTGGVVSLWIALLITLAVLPLLSDYAYPSRSLWAQKSPAVLANRAGEILSSLGHELPVADRAWGFRPDFATSGVADANLFWYRQSPTPMVPSDYRRVSEEDRITYYDPSPVGLGMVQMLVDSMGRLVTLKVVTSAIGLDLDDEQGAEAPPATDWKPALVVAGFPPDTAQSVEPTITPPYFAQEQKAWEMPDPRVPSRRLRMEAAALDGKVVFVDVRPTETAPMPGMALMASFENIYLVLFFVLSVILPVAGAILARQNLLKRRGDLSGAQRLVIFVIVAQLCRWLFAADHVSILDIEVQRINFRLGRILLEALMVWVAYIAFEPAIRRFWHEPIVSWSRLIQGRFRDPVVGRSILIGTLVGAIWALLSAADRILGRSLALDVIPEFSVALQLENVISFRTFLSTVLEMALDALYFGIFDICFLVVLRIGSRKPAVAIFGFLLVRGIWETLSGSNPGLSWLTLGLGLAGLGTILLVRFGLVAYVVAFFSYLLLNQIPLTTASSAWFAGNGFMALALIGALGSVGFHIALAGRPLAGSWLDLPEPQPGSLG